MISNSFFVLARFKFFVINIRFVSSVRDKLSTPHFIINCLYTFNAIVSSPMIEFLFFKYDNVENLSLFIYSLIERDDFKFLIVVQNHFLLMRKRTHVHQAVTITFIPQDFEQSCFVASFFVWPFKLQGHWSVHAGWDKPRVDHHYFRTITAYSFVSSFIFILLKILLCESCGSIEFKFFSLVLTGVIDHNTFHFFLVFSIVGTPLNNFTNCFCKWSYLFYLSII